MNSLFSWCFSLFWNNSLQWFLLKQHTAIIQQCVFSLEVYILVVYLYEKCSLCHPLLLKTSSRKEEWICRGLEQELTWTEEGGRTFSFISTSSGLKHDLKSESCDWHRRHHKLGHGNWRNGNAEQENDCCVFINRRGLQVELWVCICFVPRHRKPAAVPGVAVIFHSCFVLPQQSKASRDIGKLRFVPKQSLMAQGQFGGSKLR